MSTDGALNEVVDFYLSSGDFNGLPVSRDQNSQLVNDLAPLVEQGLVEVITDQDYINTHIRPWASRLAPNEQVTALRAATQDDGTLVCVYPTSAALLPRLSEADWQTEPYARRQAEGGGTLELAFFRLDVIEPYREDPRFDFSFNDFGFQFNLIDELYVDEDEPAGDKVGLLHGGLAYDVDSARDPSVRRFACVFLCDLRRFTPEMQRRWETYEVPATERLGPHPAWFRQQMGHWPEGLGPFSRLHLELGAINALFENAYGRPLFRSAQLPDEVGWIIRPSQREFDQAMLDLDKMLSDNLDHKALDSADVPRLDDSGQQIGTIARLERFLRAHGLTVENTSLVIDPLRTVRKLRQKPAHRIGSNRSDEGLIADQIDVVGDVVDGLWILRRFLMKHPDNSDVEVDDFLDEGKHFRM